MPIRRSRNFTNVVHVGADYSYEELTFLRAVDRYKSRHQRPNPTMPEILGVARALGYRRTAEPGPLPVYDGAG